MSSNSKSPPAPLVPFIEDQIPPVQGKAVDQLNLQVVRYRDDYIEEGEEQKQQRDEDLKAEIRALQMQVTKTKTKKQKKLAALKHKTKRVKEPSPQPMLEYNTTTSGPTPGIAIVPGDPRFHMPSTGMSRTNIDGIPSGISQTQHHATDAFMTQYPQKEGVVNCFMDDDLVVDLKKKDQMAEQRPLDRQNPKDRAVIEKKRSENARKQKLKKCLTYLGIKDDYMLDHFNPNFQKALEDKTKRRLAEKKALLPSYDQLGIVKGPPLDVPQRHYYIEKYSNPPSRGLSSTGTKKILPISRTVARLGHDGALVKIEQTQFPLHPNEKPKRLKVCKFQDDEIMRMCSRSIRNEKSQWKAIQQVKEGKRAPYMEPVSTASFSKQLHETQAEKYAIKRKLMTIHANIMEELAKQKKIKEEGGDASAEAELFDPEQFVDQQFKRFSISELRDHQQAILNMFHYFQNRIGAEAGLDVDDLKIDAAIFKKEIDKKRDEIRKKEMYKYEHTGKQGQLPSFKERIAFVDALKKRWREQKGYCSVFDRVRAEKICKEKAELKNFIKQQKKLLRRQKSEEYISRKSHSQLQDTRFAKYNDDLTDHNTSFKTSTNNIIELRSRSAQNQNKHKQASTAGHADTQGKEGGGAYKNLSKNTSLHENENQKTENTFNLYTKDPLSSKSLKEWGSTSHRYIPMDHRQEADLLANQKFLGQKTSFMIDQQAKKDMESLEKYMSNIKIEVQENHSNKSQGLGVKDNAISERIDGAHTPSHKLETRNTETQIRKIKIERKRKDDTLKRLHMSPSHKNVFKQQTPYGQNDGKAKEIENFISSRDRIPQPISKPKYYEGPHSLESRIIESGGDLRSSKTGSKKLGVSDFLKKSSLEDFKERVVVHLDEVGKAGDPQGPLQVRTSKSQFKIQFENKPIRAKNISPGITMLRQQNPGFIFDAASAPQNHNRMSQNKNLKHAHVRRYKQIKSMVQKQMKPRLPFGPLIAAKPEEEHPSVTGQPITQTQNKYFQTQTNFMPHSNLIYILKQRPTEEA